MQIVLFLCGFLASVVAIIAYAMAAPPEKRLGVFALLGVFAAAAAAVGGFLGFLFGIPRSRLVVIDDTSSARVVDEVPTITPRTNLPNTNLEQISDWLTKILVGVTLTQLGNIPARASRLFENMSRALGVGASGQAFTGSLVIYAFSIGFMFGWLATRAWVGLMLAATDEASIGRTDTG